MTWYFKIRQDGLTVARGEAPEKKVVRNYMSLEFGIRDKEKKPTVLQLAYSYLEKWNVK